MSLLDRERTIDIVAACLLLIAVEVIAIAGYFGVAWQEDFAVAPTGPDVNLPPEPYEAMLSEQEVQRNPGDNLNSGPIDEQGRRLFVSERFGIEVKYPASFIAERELIMTSKLGVTFTGEVKEGERAELFLLVTSYEPDVCDLLCDTLDQEEITLAGYPAILYKSSGYGDAGEIVGPSYTAWIQKGGMFYAIRIFDRGGLQRDTLDSLYRDFASSFKSWGSQYEIDTSTWKTYRNEKYGFEVKYPSDWQFEAIGSYDDQGELVAPKSEFFFTDSRLNRFIVAPLGSAINNRVENRIQEKKILFSGFNATWREFANPNGISLVRVDNFSNPKHSDFVVLLLPVNAKRYIDSEKIPEFATIISTFKFIK